jgi:hypothetical protein
VDCIAGTIGASSICIFGKGRSLWGLAPVIPVLDLFVGSITWKPVVVEGQVVPREILNLTVIMDHDVIDGVPAARFVRRLVELVEGLE